MLCEVHSFAGVGATHLVAAVGLGGGSAAPYVVSVAAFLLTWISLSLLGAIAIFSISGAVFLAYYARPTYEQWRRKINPAYPSPEKVKSEVLQTLKGLVVATLCPALSLHLAQDGGLSRAFCGSGGYGALYHAACFAIVWLASDIYEWAYHVLGHSLALSWQHHRAHHVFFNPSPFSVIADEAVDQFMRSTPLLIFPLVMPINMDLLFSTYLVFFYCYGVALHWGFESDFLSAHQSIVNGPYEHYYHHALSSAKSPIYCGFFFKLWDSLLGSVPAKDAACVCSRCEELRGKRTRAQFDALVLPAYSALLRPSFWLSASQASDHAKEL